MKKITLNNLDLNIYKSVLDNGLVIYICPMKKQSTHASLVAKFGSDYLDFIPISKKDYLTIPEGSAHFLEHKMFETKDGKDPMDLYAGSGAVSNAYTSCNITRYYFTGAYRFYDNLKILLDCITNPYFTKENIQKERGIITQEINSSLDDPEQKIYYLANKNLFNNHPHKYTVAGTKNSIKKITTDILYDCYNTFYHPSNMYLVITGKVDPKNALNYIQKYYADKKYKKSHNIKLKDYHEKNKVKRKQSNITMDITNNLVSIAYKVKINIDRFYANLYILIYLDILFSEISESYYLNHQDKNLLSHINYFIENVDNYVIIYFDVYVQDKIDIIDKINKEINKKEINKKDFTLIVKNLYNSTLLSLEDVEKVANFIVNEELLYGKVHENLYDIYKNISYEKCINFIKSLDFSNYTKIIIKPHLK